MKNTKLIMFEGMPGTGKTTNAQFLRIQLERNGKTVKWMHEVARPHPTLFFQEACMTYGEWDAFLQKYPDAAEILEKTAIRRDRTVGFDLLGLEWNYGAQIGETAMEALRQYDVWKFPIEKYREFALDKWTRFVEEAMHEKDVVYILDAGLLQFHIFTFLLQNIAYEELEKFVLTLADLIRPLNPSLIYFYRENPEKSISFLEARRGTAFLEYLWERDKKEAYYKDKPSGAEGARLFLKTYAFAASRLFSRIDFPKLAMEISKQDWKAYERKILSFIEIAYKPDMATIPPRGVYTNTQLHFEIEIDGYNMKDPGGTNRRLIPKSEDAFYVEGLPVIIQFNKTGTVTVVDGQINKRWTSLGTQFIKRRE